jgi:hypothetical protein
MRRKDAVSEIDPAFEMLEPTGPALWLALHEKFEKVAVFKIRSIVWSCQKWG